MQLVLAGESNNLNGNFNAIDPDENLLLPNNEICNYYCLDEYVELCRNNNYHKNLQILNFNIQIIVMTKTWNTESNEDLCFLENYQVQHTYRNKIKRGGVSIFCLNDLIMKKYLVCPSVMILLNHAL